MRSGLIAQKLGMTRIYTAEGTVVPVTVLKVDYCQVVAQKTNDKDGYTALQLGAGVPKIKRLTKPSAATLRSPRSNRSGNSRSFACLPPM